MSKYEPRAKEIQAAAAEIGFKLTWKRRAYSIYVTADSIVDTEKVLYASLVVLFSKYYDLKDMRVTSWNGHGGTFFLYSMIDLLKK